MSKFCTLRPFYENHITVEDFLISARYYLHDQTSLHFSNTNISFTFREKIEHLNFVRKIKSYNVGYLLCCTQ